jgi:hypothetical protein
LGDWVLEPVEEVGELGLGAEEGAEEEEVAVSAGTLWLQPMKKFLIKLMVVGRVGSRGRERHERRERGEWQGRRRSEFEL